jgi:hypothetical protein
MFEKCSSWPPVAVFDRFSHISRTLGLQITFQSVRLVLVRVGRLPFFLRGARLHSMDFRTSKQNFYRKLFVMGGGGSLYTRPGVCGSRCVCTQTHNTRPSGVYTALTGTA